MSPWEVLGIDPTPDERAIKRAYAKQLKQTRPDEDKEGFLRLRAAYEHALEIRHWHEDADEEEDDDSEVISPPLEPEPEPEPVTAPEPAVFEDTPPAATIEQIVPPSESPQDLAHNRVAAWEHAGVDSDEALLHQICTDLESPELIHLEARADYGNRLLFWLMRQHRSYPESFRRSVRLFGWDQDHVSWQARRTLDYKQRLADEDRQKTESRLEVLEAGWRQAEKLSASALLRRLQQDQESPELQHLEFKAAYEQHVLAWLVVQEHLYPLVLDYLTNLYGWNDESHTPNHWPWTQLELYRQRCRLAAFVSTPLAFNVQPQLLLPLWFAANGQPGLLFRLKLMLPEIRARLRTEINQFREAFGAAILANPEAAGRLSALEHALDSNNLRLPIHALLMTSLLSLGLATHPTLADQLGLDAVTCLDTAICTLLLAAALLYLFVWRVFTPEERAVMDRLQGPEPMPFATTMTLGVLYLLVLTRAYFAPSTLTHPVLLGGFLLGAGVSMAILVYLRQLGLLAQTLFPVVLMFMLGALPGIDSPKGFASMPMLWAPVIGSLVLLKSGPDWARKLVGYVFFPAILFCGFLILTLLISAMDHAGNGFAFGWLEAWLLCYFSYGYVKSL